MESVLPFIRTPSASAPSHLKLFEQGASRVGPQSSLRECFETYILPELDERAETTLVEYQGMLHAWEALSGNPAVAQIDRQTVKTFRTKLLETPYKRGKKGRKLKRTPGTVNKIMRHFKAAIGPLWPPDRHNPGGKGFVPFFRLPEALPRQKKLVFYFDLKSLSALYEAADACKLPRQKNRKSPLYEPLLWRTALALAFNTGPRTWDLFELQWDDLYDDHRYGSIFYRARKTSKDQRPPLNRVSRIHLDAVRKLNLDPVRIFPGFEKGKAFYDAWERICHRAGIHDKPFESFRKTCSTHHNNHSGDQRVGEWLCGHGKRGVNAEFYDNATKAVLEAVYTLRLPAAFRRGAKALLQSPG